MSESLAILPAAGACRRCAARIEVAATLAALFDAHADIAAVRWVQRDRGSLVDALVVEFTDGTAFHGHDGGPQRRTPTPEAYAVLADLVLYDTDLLFEAFGLSVAVVATRGGLDAKPLPR